MLLVVIEEGALDVVHHKHRRYYRNARCCLGGAFDDYPLLFMRGHNNNYFFGSISVPLECFGVLLELFKNKSIIRVIRLFRTFPGGRRHLNLLGLLLFDATDQGFLVDIPPLDAIIVCARVVDCSLDIVATDVVGDY